MLVNTSKIIRIVEEASVTTLGMHQNAFELSKTTFEGNFQILFFESAICGLTAPVFKRCFKCFEIWLKLQFSADKKFQSRKSQPGVVQGV